MEFFVVQKLLSLFIGVEVALSTNIYGRFFILDCNLNILNLKMNVMHNKNTLLKDVDV